ncbi:MAG: hypothetical protein D6693_04420 [Planctomycetota bacterium]|nr:MAG: hypothetical protein D6693_04420 [Planctomycetota bacterium]
MALRCGAGARASRGAGVRGKMTVRRDIAAGLVWATAERWGRHVLSFVVYVALARLLAPEAFGLVALAAVVTSFCQLFVSQGFGTAIIQREDLRDAHLDTAFWISLALSTGLFVVMVLAAGPIAAVAGEPGLAPVLRWLAAVVPINSLASVPAASLTRQMRFRPLAVRSTLGVLAGGAAGVGMALAGFGVWSLVGQQLTAAVVGVAALWSASRWRPGLRAERRAFGELFGFSANVLATNVLWFFSQQLDKAVIGVGLGPVALGVYFLAQRLMTLVLDLLTAPLQAVALPWMSRKQADRAALGAAYSRALRLAGLVMFPVFFGLATVAREVTPMVFGAVWADAGPVLAVLAIAAALRGAQTFVHPVMMAAGRPGVFLSIMVAHTAWTTAAIVAGYRFGAVGVAWAMVASSAIALAVNAVALRALAGVSIRTQASSVFGPAVASVVMAGAVLAMRRALPGATPPIVVVAASVVLGVGVFAAGSWWLCRDAARDAVAVARRIAGARGDDTPSAPDHSPATDPSPVTPEMAAAS